MGAVHKAVDGYTDAASATLLGVGGWLLGGFIKKMLPDSPVLANALNIGVGVIVYSHSPDMMGKAHSKYAKRVAVGMTLRGSLDLLNDLTTPATAGLPPSDKGMLNVEQDNVENKKAYVPPTKQEFLTTQEMVNKMNLPEFQPKEEGERASLYQRGAMKGKTQYASL